MLIQQYLVKKIWLRWFTITSILLLLFLSNQLIRYLDKVAAGQLAGIFIAKIMLLEIPHYLSLLTPLGFFAALIAVFTELSSSHELIAIRSFGVSVIKLTRWCLMIALPLFIFLILLNSLLLPYCLQMRNAFLAQNNVERYLQAIIPGKFMRTQDNIFYIGAVNTEQQIMTDIFFAKKIQLKNEKTQQWENTWQVLTAPQAKIKFEDTLKDIFIVAEHGQRYVGLPGQKNYRIEQFREYGLRVNQAIQQTSTINEEALPTRDLWKMQWLNPRYAAEWQWRFSLPFSLFSFVLLGVSLGQLPLRKNRYLAIIPATIIFLFYMNSLFLGRAWLQKSTIALFPGLWGVQLLLLSVAMTIFYIKPKLNR